MRSASETMIPAGPRTQAVRQSALVLADAADQSVALGRRPIDSRPQVVDLEGDVAQSQLGPWRPANPARSKPLANGVVSVGVDGAGAHSPV